MSERVIAFYLPQFHPIPENDAWWGKGFTEWTNVAKAQSLFRGHVQPNLPGDLGFYDLRLPETRAAQAALAAQYGIAGFCYWHYWFQGKRLLERPFNEVLTSDEPDFPFCLAWANESWSRRWLGEEKQILIAQTYSPEDDVAHARWLTQCFADPRYLRVESRPLFLMYRPRDLPNPQQTLDTLRQESQRAGLPEPYLVGIDAHCYGMDLRTLGFDDTLAFEPQLGVLPNALTEGWSIARIRQNLAVRRAATDGYLNGARATRRALYFAWQTRDLKLNDDAAARQRMESIPRLFPYLPSVYVGWDNTPRRGRKGIVITNNTPQQFGDALARKIAQVQPRPPEQRLVFINAWNEWAEGNHLEPDLKNQHGYLEQIPRALNCAESDRAE